MICAISGGASRQLTDTLTAPSFASAERDLEPLEAVLVDERHPVARADAGGGAARAATWLERRVELAEGDGAVADLERRASGRSAAWTRMMSASVRIVVRSTVSAVVMCVVSPWSCARLPPSEAGSRPLRYDGHPPGIR